MAGENKYANIITLQLIQFHGNILTDRPLKSMNNDFHIRSLFLHYTQEIANKVEDLDTCSLSTIYIVLTCLEGTVMEDGVCKEAFPQTDLKDFYHLGTETEKS